MSKCKPQVDSRLPTCVIFEEEQHKGERYIVLKVPYEEFLENLEVQKAFQGLIKLSTEE